ncbi:hypothetical protein [Winogradskyella marincola]|uniref:Competence protein CoiA-like family protein n=1 Tax=Winogradskyella marincola TaxID=3037795 RepID=A0ABT6G516_9FLAO|nr:hypothetical protein [Winogradskyella sp. YYF002]MDG4717130.1 hypothetical protein [Winogradskyella sp. YYF002]
MPLEEKKYDIEANNDWAKNVKGEHLFIDDAQSGRKGYFCIGCDKQMEAVIRKKNPKHRSYFRHVPVDVEKDNTPCTFSNLQYRETLATDILQRIKTIKVPNVYKYPPRGEDGAPMLLEKAKFVTANKVKSQLTFYEDINGAIKFGKNPEVEDRYLLIRPDVTFFDANNIPVLLIELVVTHKVKEEKKIKLRRLGIDTVSIIVPKSSAQDIEDNFKTTKRVKWEYNGIEANTKYIRVSSGTSEGVLEFDEYQRRVFEESLSCRKTRLNNTLRTIKKCLQSEPYRRAEYDFESEISRIESATKEAEQRLTDLEKRFEREVLESLTERYRDFELKQKEFRVEREKFQNRVEKLEKRYLAKIKEIRDQQESVDQHRAIELKDNRTEAEIREDFSQYTERLEGDFRSRRDRITKLIESERRSLDEFSGEHNSLPEQFRYLDGVARQEFETARTSLEQQERDLPEQFRGLEEQEQREFETAREKLKKEEAELEKTVREEFYRTIQTNPRELPKGIRTILEAQRVGHDFEDAKRKEQRYKSARELFNKGTWKTW